MSTESTTTEVESIEHGLREYVALGVLDYYLPTIPAGEWYVVGAENQIIKLSPDQAPAFLAGAGVVARFLARRAGMNLYG